MTGPQQAPAQPPVYAQGAYMPPHMQAPAPQYYAQPPMQMQQPYYGQPVAPVAYGQPVVYAAPGQAYGAVSAYGGGAYVAAPMQPPPVVVLAGGGGVAMDPLPAVPLFSTCDRVMFVLFSALQFGFSFVGSIWHGYNATNGLLFALTFVIGCFAVFSNLTVQSSREEITKRAGLLWPTALYYPIWLVFAVLAFALTLIDYSQKVRCLSVSSPLPICGFFQSLRSPNARPPRFLLIAAVHERHRFGRSSSVRRLRIGVRRRDRLLVRRLDHRYDLRVGDGHLFACAVWPSGSPHGRRRLCCQ
jgi:hypothetical protein